MLALLFYTAFTSVLTTPFPSTEYGAWHIVINEMLNWNIK